MKYYESSIVCLVALILLVTAGVQANNASAQAVLPTEYISVGNYSGTANQRIDAAIADAITTDHKTVYFPDGTYALRERVDLNRGTNTELHLIGESRAGVLLVPDVAYLEANYNDGSGPRLTHMLNLDKAGTFDSVDVSIQNMTLDMRNQLVLGEEETYRTFGHGVRVGSGWREGQFTVNEVTIRNVGSYGVGIQDRGGHPKNNVTLTNLNIERTGSDGIDTKNTAGDGSRNLVIRNVNINEVGFLDEGAAPAIDIRYRTATIENVNLVSQASRSTLPGQTSNTTGIVFRSNGGVLEADVSGVYTRGFKGGVIIQSSDTTRHENIALSDFYIQGQEGAGVSISGNNHGGHTISDGFVDPGFGGTAVRARGQAVVSNVVAGRRDPALTPTTDTTFEGNVSLAGNTFSPAWQGIVGSERVSLNPTAPSIGAFVFDVGDTGVLQIDFDTFYNAMDKLIVDGTLNLDGELLVNMIDGTPATPATYQIFEADTITGSFDTFTLPTVSGLNWFTDDLTTAGTLSLAPVTQASPITYGDKNNTSYNASSPDDNPPIDADFMNALAAISSSWTFKGLDENGRNDVRAMTFYFEEQPANELESVWIEARIFGESGYGNDKIRLDAVGNRRGIDDMEGFETGGGWMTLRYELSEAEFELLSDGQLNLAFDDDTRVDWVTLSWDVVPEPSSLSLLGLGGLLLTRRSAK